jgi:hypothetical protein
MPVKFRLTGQQSEGQQAPPAMTPDSFMTSLTPDSFMQGNPDVRSTWEKAKDAVSAVPGAVYKYVGDHQKFFEDEAQRQANEAYGPEAEKNGIASRIGHAILSPLAETGNVAYKTARGLMDPVNASVLASGVIDPAVPAAFFGTQAVKGVYDTGSKLVEGDASPENVQNLFLNGAQLAGSGAAAASPKAGAALKSSTIKPALDVFRGSLASRKVPDSGGMTTGELYSTMRDQGVDMNLAQAGEGKLARHAEDLSSRTAGGAGRMAKYRDAQAGQFSDAVNTIQDKFDPTGAGKDVAEQGAQLQRALQTGQDVAHQNAADAFRNNLSPLFNYSTADTGDIATAALALKNRLSQGQIEGLKPTAAISLLDEIAQKYGDQANNKSMFDDVFRDRSRLMKSQFSDANVAGENEAAMREMGATMRTSLENAAQKHSPQALAQFNDAMQQWSDYLDNFQDKRSPIVRALNQADPSKVVEGFIGPNGTGNLTAIQKLGEVAPAFKDLLKREFVRRLVDPRATGVREAYASMNKNLLQYSEPFLNALFTPEELQQVRGLALGGKALNLDINPSGSGKYAGSTATTMAQGAAALEAARGLFFHDPASAALGVGASVGIPAASNIAARTLTNRPLTDYLMDYQPPGTARTGPSLMSQSQAPAAGSNPTATTIPNPFGRTAQKYRRTGTRP